MKIKIFNKVMATAMIAVMAAMTVLYTSSTIIADDGSALSSIISGSGSENDPYIISTEEQLALIQDIPEAHYRLADNIELSGSWSGQPFSGVLDGNGYKITIEESDNGFIYSNSGTIKNLSLEINDESTFPALLTWTNSGTIQNVHISGAMASNRASYLGSAALINRESGIIENTYSTASVSYLGEIKNGNGTQCYGVFVGLNEGTITNCYWRGSYSYQVTTFTGENDGALTSCHQGGEYGKSDIAMQLEATYTGWDFENTWKIDPDFNNGLPVLQNEREFIKIPVSGIELDHDTLTVEINKTASLTATVSPSDAWDKNITWSSSDETVAAIAQDGTISPLSLGETVITATTDDGGFSASCIVTVIPPIIHVTELTLDRSEATLEVGESLALTAQILPDDATYKTILWSSSDAAVASVSDGTVTALSPGTAVITVTSEYDGITTSCTITVIRTAAERYDINGNGVCDNEDAALLARYLAGHSDTGITAETADANGDGEMNSRDVTALLQYIDTQASGGAEK